MQSSSSTPSLPSTTPSVPSTTPSVPSTSTSPFEDEDIPSHVAVTKTKPSSTHTTLIVITLIIALIALFLASLNLFLFWHSKNSTDESPNNDDPIGPTDNNEYWNYFPVSYNSDYVTTITPKNNYIYNIMPTGTITVTPTININAGTSGVAFILNTFSPDIRYNINSTVNYRFGYPAFNDGIDQVSYISYSSLFIQVNQTDGLVYPLFTPKVNPRPILP